MPHHDREHDGARARAALLALGDEVRAQDDLARYLGAIYWSVSCLKGTDNDWAVTMAEKMVAVAVMIAGGGVYTIMIGEVANVLSNLDMAGNEYKRTMDNLNQCARARARRAAAMQSPPLTRALFVAFSGTCPTTTLSPSSRSSCAYFLHCKSLFRTEYHHDTLRKMSPQLRGEVANHENSGWVMSIGFFAQVPEEEQMNLITEIAVMLALACTARATRSCTRARRTT